MRDCYYMYIRVYVYKMRHIIVNYRDFYCIMKGEFDFNLYFSVSLISILDVRVLYWKMCDENRGVKNRAKRCHRSFVADWRTKWCVDHQVASLTISFMASYATVLRLWYFLPVYAGEILSIIKPDDFRLTGKNSFFGWN